MSISPIISGISTGLSVLETLTGANRKAATTDAGAVTSVDKVRQRKNNQLARLEEAAQALGVQTSALQQALQTARQQVRTTTGNILDSAAQQLGVQGSALKQTLQRCGVKMVDETV